MESNDTQPAPFRPIATWVLVGMCILVYAAVSASTEENLLSDTRALVDAGALDPVSIWRGEVWRLATAMFLHGAFWHVLLNLWVLWQVGRLLERMVGPSRYLLIYLLSGIAGFALSLLVSPIVSVGASGAIFGVVGALLGVGQLEQDRPTGKILVSALLPFVVLTLLIGYFIPFVDNSAHIGGLVAGFLLGYALTAGERIPNLEGDSGRVERVGATKKRFASGVLVATGVGITLLVVASVRPTFSPQYAVHMAWNALERGEEEQAKDFTDKANALAPEDASVLLLTGRMKLVEGDAAADRFLEKALAAFDEDPRTALELAVVSIARKSDDGPFFRDPMVTDALCRLTLKRESAKRSVPVLNNCAWLRLNATDPEVQDPKSALTLARRAMKLNAGNDGFFAEDLQAAVMHTRAEAEAQNGNFDEAIAVLERIQAEEITSEPFYLFELDRIRREAKRLSTRSGPPPPTGPAPAAQPAGGGPAGEGAPAAQP